MSKERNKALIGAAGVDEQYNDRFLCIRILGEKIKKRKVFKKYGKADYKEACYIKMRKLHLKEFKRMIKLGKKDATKEANRFLEEMHSEYKISKLAPKIKAVAEEKAQDLVKYIFDIANGKPRDLTKCPEKTYNAIKNNVCIVSNKEGKWICLKNNDLIIPTYTKETTGDDSEFRKMDKSDELKFALCKAANPNWKIGDPFTIRKKMQT